MRGCTAMAEQKIGPGGLVKKILETNRLWVWGFAAVLAIALVVLGYRALQMEEHLITDATKQNTQGKSQEREPAPVIENLQSKLDSAEKEIQKLKEAAATAEARAGEYEKQIALLRQGRASCEEFFDGWDINAAPPSIVTLFGVAREVSAANDCMSKDDASTACRHWKGLLVQIEKIGSPVSDSRVEIEKLMRQNKCE